MLGERLGEDVAVAGLVARQVEAACERYARELERGFERGAAATVDQAMRDARLLQDRKVIGDCIDLLGRAQQLQDAVGGAFVLESDLAPQALQAAQAVVRQVLHARLVDAEALGPALAQPAHHPREHRGVGAEVELERRVLLTHPAQRLGAHARCGPRRCIARADVAAVGEARLQADAFAAVDHRHLVAILREVVRGGDADHAGAEDQDLQPRLFQGGLRTMLRWYSNPARPGDATLHVRGGASEPGEHRVGDRHRRGEPRRFDAEQIHESRYAVVARARR